MSRPMTPSTFASSRSASVRFALVTLAPVSFAREEWTCPGLVDTGVVG